MKDEGFNSTDWDENPLVMSLNKGSARPCALIKRYANVVGECSLGPVNLLSSSCILEFSHQNEAKLAFCDHTSKLRLCGLNSKNEFETTDYIEDPHLGKMSRLWGLKYDPWDNGMIALRYMDGISIFQNNEDQKFGLKSRILTQEGFCDMSFLPFIDSVVAIDVNGNLVLHDYHVSEKTFL